MMTKAMTKLLPYSHEAEQAVLGSILNDAQAVYTALSILNPVDFFSNKHALIFKAMEAVSRKDGVIDILSIADVLRHDGKLQEVGGIDFLSKLEGIVQTSQAISHYSRIVRQKAKLRKLVKVGYQLTQQAWEEIEEPEALIEFFQSELYEIGSDLQNKGGKKQVFGPEEIAQLAAENAAEWLADPEKARGIKTGFTRLDSIILGLKDINIVSASTGVGKTAFAINLAVRIAINQKIPTLYLNHEMNFEELTLRLQGIISGVPVEMIRRGRYNDGKLFGKVTAASEKIRDGKLFMTSNEAKTINTIISLIQKYKAQHDVEVVILDYLGEIEPTKEELRESEYLIYGRWIQRLKGACTSLGIKLVLLAQLNREGDREVSKNKIGGSWKIVQKADVFLILGVDKKGRYFLKIDKNRNGPAPKEIALDFDKETQRIHEGD